MKKLLITFIIGLGLFIIVPSVHAATSFTFAPVSGSYSAGSTVKVSVYANTESDSVNAIQANIAYPADKLEFVSIGTGGSALEIFTEKSVKDGVIYISGGTPSPGFSGKQLIATISFKVLSDSGKAALSITSDSAALRNSDNKDILSSRGTASFTLRQESSGVPPADEPTNEIIISDIVIESVTTSQAIISWKTDIESDSSVEYGKDLTYGFTEFTREMTTDHRVVLANYLLPGSVYHFHVRSRDVDGKEGLSDDAILKTKGFDVMVRVKDVVGKPISNATVILYTEPQEEMKSDAEGVARFIGVAPGKHGVVVKHNNQTLINEVEVLDGQPLTTIDVSFAGSRVGGFPKISAPVLYSIVGVIALLVIVLTLFVILRNRRLARESETTIVQNIGKF